MYRSNRTPRKRQHRTGESAAKRTEVHEGGWRGGIDEIIVRYNIQSPSHRLVKRMDPHSVQPVPILMVPERKSDRSVCLAS
jgi:hypothetical protein